MTPANAAQPRRLPRQQRSRERHERILATARGLIAERGNDAVSMREIAEASGVPISSIYQYFPDKNALLWALISEFLDRFETEWQTLIDAADSPDALRDAALAAFDLLVAHCEDDASFARLWMSAQANAVLVELDRALNERLAESFTRRMRTLAPSADGRSAFTRTLLMATLASTAVQFAFSREGDRTELLDAFRTLLRRSLAEGPP